MRLNGSGAWPPRRIVSCALMLARGVAIQHLVAHAGLGPLPLSMGWQDVLVGYLMVIVVAMLIDPHGV